MLVHQAHVAGLREERRLVDEAPERDQRVDRAGLARSPAGCARASPRRTSTSTRVVLAGVEAPRARDDDSRMRSISGSRCGRPPGEPVEAREHQQASEERVEEVERGGAEQQREEEQAAIDAADRQRAMECLVDTDGTSGRSGVADLVSTSASPQNSQARNCAANSASPPPKTMPEICRFAPPSPNMNIRPPITIATRASDRASGPVNVARGCWRRAPTATAASEHGGRECHSRQGSEGAPNRGAALSVAWELCRPEPNCRVRLPFSVTVSPRLSS